MPAEGSVLPDTYEIERGESRQAVLLRMQAAMQRTLAELWEKRAPGLRSNTPQEALSLAAIVEKETGKPSEREMVAGLYSNRLRQGIMLQADPTIIYPITKGKPLGRRIRQSEIQAINDYNTYSMIGLPNGPITNPGRASIAAVLNPAKTDALYMVADGTGGHLFAPTLQQHNANVERWFAIRRARGEISGLGDIEPPRHRIDRREPGFDQRAVALDLEPGRLKLRQWQFQEQQPQHQPARAGERGRRLARTRLIRPIIALRGQLDPGALLAVGDRQIDATAPPEFCRIEPGRDRIEQQLGRNRRDHVGALNRSWRAAALTLRKSCAAERNWLRQIALSA